MRAQPDPRAIRELQVLPVLRAIWVFKANKVQWVCRARMEQTD